MLLNWIIFFRGPLLAYPDAQCKSLGVGDPASPPEGRTKMSVLVGLDDRMRFPFAADDFSGDDVHALAA